MKLEPILDAHAAPVPPALSSDRMGELFIQAGKLSRAQVGGRTTYWCGSEQA